jgi:hypothetical protein
VASQRAVVFGWQEERTSSIEAVTVKHKGKERKKIVDDGPRHSFIEIHHPINGENLFLIINKCYIIFGYLRELT